MRGQPRSIRRVVARRRGPVAALGATTVLVGAVLGLAAGPVSAGAMPAGSPTPLSWSNPTASGHGYRHGALPRVVGAVTAGALRSAAMPASPPPARRGLGRGANPVLYWGGPVATGLPRVYVVFWGPSWGAQSTGTGGYQVFSNDPAGFAPDLQAFYSGLGTNGELWSGTVTQYCQNAALRAHTCSALPASNHVAFPSSDVLAGVWEDTTSFSPPLGTRPGDYTVGGATGVQLAQEAAHAAAHFGNTSVNVNAQYVIVSPTLANPDNWLNPTSGYCAYHDDTQDTYWKGAVPGPDVAYTNLPYIPDLGATGCASTGMNGLLDGANEATSHEYAEIVTDPWPGAGWADRRGNEVGDKCAYLNPGTPGAAVYLHLATGTFDVQGLWANDASKRGGCETSHPAILTANPGGQKAVVGTPVTLAVKAVDLRGLSLTYSAAGLPAGLTINRASGVVSGTPTSRGRPIVTVNASDASSTASVSFKWTVSK